VHLRDTDLGRDLRLRHLMEESQLDDLTLTFIKRIESRGYERSILYLRLAELFTAEFLGEAVVRAFLERCMK
jgi:hypothetical protein